MEIPIWEMVVTTERHLMERRLERAARLGDPDAKPHAVSRAIRLLRGRRIRQSAAGRVRPQEAV